MSTVADRTSVCRRSRAAAFALLFAVVLTACDSARRAPPNVLLLVVDTLRADHTSLHGYERDTTPNLAAFAERALVYDAARATSSWTKPSVASLMTGLSTTRHGVEQDDGKLPEAATTLAELLAASGYRTGLFSDNPYVSRAFGFAQGFEHVYDYVSRPIAEPSGEEFADGADGAIRRDEHVDWARRAGAGALNRELLEWIDSFGEREPWLAHVQYMEPHWPYAPPPPFDTKFTDEPVRRSELPNLWHVATGFAGSESGAPATEAERRALIDAYDSAVAYWDSEFGALVAALDARGRLRDTIVVVTSDHGEGFYEHDLWAHQNSLYEELVRVPLVIRGRGLMTGRVERDVSLERIVGTLLALTGHDPREIGSGDVLGDKTAPAWTARLERNGRSLVATIEGDRKWVVYGGEGERTESFDLASDPGEQRDLARDLAQRAEVVREQLEARLAREADGALPRETAQTTADMEEALRALGYVE